MVDTFDEAVTGDYIQATDLNQIFDAWQGVADKGVPLRLTQVDSATYYAGDFRNKHANGYHFRVKNASDETLFSLVGDVITFGKDVTLGAGLYVDGVDVGEHVHSGDAGDAPQLTAGSYGAGTIPAAAFATGAIAAAVTGALGLILTKRQGGGTTHWNAAGTTDYTPSAPYIQVGAVSATGGTTGYQDIGIAFPTAFTYYPLVFAIAQDNLLAPLGQTVSPHGITETACTLRLFPQTAGGTTYGTAIFWMAIGPIA